MQAQLKSVLLPLVLLFATPGHAGLSSGVRDIDPIESLRHYHGAMTLMRPIVYKQSEYISRVTYLAADQKALRGDLHKSYCKVVAPSTLSLNSKNSEVSDGPMEFSIFDMIRSTVPSGYTMKLAIKNGGNVDRIEVWVPGRNPDVQEVRTALYGCGLLLPLRNLKPPTETVKIADDIIHSMRRGD